MRIQPGPRKQGGKGARRRTALVCLPIAIAFAACAAPPPPATTEVQALWQDAVAESPEAATWKEVPFHMAEMLPQDFVEPRLLTPSTQRVRVQAVHDGTRVAFRLSWEDPTEDQTPGPSRFSDACAIQVPQRTEPDLPDPMMGNAGRSVEITFWRASWQASVLAGSPDKIQSLYPAATVDHYPFEAPSLAEGSEAQREFADRYAPAAALGARREGPRESAVEDLVADGPGTIRPADRAQSTGNGRRTTEGWEVVIVRPLPAGLAPGGRSQVAVAVWDGERGEVGGRKMRSAWIPLVIEPRAGAETAADRSGS